MKTLYSIPPFENDALVYNGLLHNLTVWGCKMSKCENYKVATVHIADLLIHGLISGVIFIVFSHS